MHLALLVALALVVAAPNDSTYSTDNPDMTTTLIITASVSTPKANVSECVVLRQTNKTIRWDATCSGTKDVRSGILEVSGDILKDTYQHMDAIEDSKTPNDTTDQTRHIFYSALLIDEAGVKASAILQEQQVEALRDQLLIVFDDIRKAQVYAKRNIMLDLISLPGTVRSVTNAPQKREPKSVFPPKHGEGADLKP